MLCYPCRRHIILSGIYFRLPITHIRDSRFNYCSNAIGLLYALDVRVYVRNKLENFSDIAKSVRSLNS